MQKKFSRKLMTSFRQKVYEAVKKIPRGKVMTYKEVAQATGGSWAFRAVGNILSENHDPAVPCHRVIRSDGTVGGYNGGTNKKIALLIKEGVVIKKGRVV